VFGHVVDLRLAQDTARLGGLEGVVERGRRVRREVVHHHADAHRLGVLFVHQRLHPVRELVRGPLLRHLHMTPAAVEVVRDEQIRGAVPHVLVVDACGRSRLRRGRGGGGRRGDRRLRSGHFADQLGGALVETDHGTRGIGRLRIQIEHVLHPCDILAVNLRDTPHLPLPGLQFVLREATAHRVPADRVVVREAHHRVRQ
jgi:hypothetical protein